MHIWCDEEGDICVEWAWSGGRLGLAQNKGEEDSWYLALKDDDGGEGSCGVLPFEMVNWDQLEHWLGE
jgi:hypothetical protein